MVCKRGRMKIKKDSHIYLCQDDENSMGDRHDRYCRNYVKPQCAALKMNRYSFHTSPTLRRLQWQFRAVLLHWSVLSFPPRHIKVNLRCIKLHCKLYCGIISSSDTGISRNKIWSSNSLAEEFHWNVFPSWRRTCGCFRRAAWSCLPQAYSCTSSRILHAGR